ncbi:o-succinylbenzoate synthase [Thalassobacillus devorans]|uniref:o-succinylbenzoate synthase n=1 Tax=Thalassobacillus devorans TaxID=279813 RepID=UPI00048E78AF|nr:o-succinylbenzoate synthase [Thalassobacillus devorans]
MNIAAIHLRRIEMPLKKPFDTHAGQVLNRELIIVEAVDIEGRRGFGEVTAFSTPFYTAETIHTAWELLNKVFIPTVEWHKVAHPSNIAVMLAGYQGNEMAKAGLEAALWDLCAKQKMKSLSDLIGGTRRQVDTGVVLSLSDDIGKVIEDYQKEGYRRYKLKVEKYKEAQAIQKVSEYSQELPIMIDMNGMYEEKDLPYLEELDSHELMMIEQPFRAGDFFLHQQLQNVLKTPLCLDESIRSLADAEQAIRMKSSRVINIKISRVGGMTEAMAIHDLCRTSDIPVWCGGMVESGISRAHNIALASLEGFSIPGDISASSRFWEKDLIVPEVKVKKGKVEVPAEPGIGFEIDGEYLQYVTRVEAAFQVN